MTIPARSSGVSFLTVAFDPAMDAWCFTGAAPGPAGTVSVVLDDDVRLSVDAADPGRIVQVTVCPELAPPAMALTRALLGAPAAEFLNRADCPAGIETRIEIGAQTAIRSSAAGLAVALAAISQPRLAHRLRGLDVILHAHRVGHPSPEVDATRASWTVWPAVVALARACCTYVPLLRSAPAYALSELHSRLLILLHLVTQDDPSVRASQAYQLVNDLAARIAPKPPDPLPGVDLKSTLKALAEDFEEDFEGYPRLPAAVHTPVLMGSMVVPRRMTWTGSVDDFSTRLRADLRLLHSGQITARGEAPGELRVTVPVAQGAATADLCNIRVRAVTEDGHLIDTGLLEVAPDPDGLPTAVARITLPETVAGHRYKEVVVDLARQEIPAPDAAELSRLDRLRAIRAGQEAVAYAAAGEHRASARLWRRCADQLDRMGEHALRDQAREHAAGAEAQASLEPVGQAGSEWLTALLGGWSRWTMTELTHLKKAAQCGRIEHSITELRTLVDRLTGWNDPSVELARARVQLSRELWSAAEHAEEPGEAEYQMREAMRIYYDLGRDEAALECLKELGSRTR